MKPCLGTVSSVGLLICGERIKTKTDSYHHIILLFFFSSCAWHGLVVPVSINDEYACVGVMPGVLAQVETHSNKKILHIISYEEEEKNKTGARTK